MQHARPIRNNITGLPLQVARGCLQAVQGRNRVAGTACVTPSCACQPLARTTATAFPPTLLPGTAPPPCRPAPHVSETLGSTRTLGMDLSAHSVPVARSSTARTTPLPPRPSSRRMRYFFSSPRE